MVSSQPKTVGLLRARSLWKAKVGPRFLAVFSGTRRRILCVRSDISGFFHWNLIIDNELHGICYTVSILKTRPNPSGRQVYGGIIPTDGLPGVRDLAKEQARPGGPMLDGEEERVIDLNHYGLGLLGRWGGWERHDDGGCGCGFRSFFIDLDEGPLDDLGDLEPILGPMCHAAEVRRAFRQVEGRKESERP